MRWCASQVTVAAQVVFRCRPMGSVLFLGHLRPFTVDVRNSRYCSAEKHGSPFQVFTGVLSAHFPMSVNHTSPFSSLYLPPVQKLRNEHFGLPGAFLSAASGFVLNLYGIEATEKCR